jgi:hypothetical protein
MMIGRWERERERERAEERKTKREERENALWDSLQIFHLNSVGRSVDLFLDFEELRFWQIWHARVRYF